MNTATMKQNNMTTHQRMNSIALTLLLISQPLMADNKANPQKLTPAQQSTSTSTADTATKINSDTKAQKNRHPRQMQIYSIPELGIKVGAENQPPWEVNISHEGKQATFTAQSPENYYPPTAMTFTAFPKEKVATAQLPIIASSAIERASQNFGLTEAQANTLIKTPAQYGVLQGYESNFHTQLQGTSMDVKIFVGQAKGQYPVALSIYTLAGKMPLLSEVIRRSWDNLAYL
jgi:hypothetical protein